MATLPFVCFVCFICGLAFFSMGLLVMLEGNRASDLRLRRALRPLAGFGILHGIHTWVEMLGGMESALGYAQPSIPEYLRLALLAISLLFLISFGVYLLAYSETSKRVIPLVPIGLLLIWIFGLASFRDNYPLEELWDVVDVWTRYVLAVPGGVLAAIGLLAQQRSYRRSGLVRFERDALWAALAFVCYGIVGQVFIKKSAFPPSTIINQDVFLELFGFPVQLFRAVIAIAIAIFIIRFLYTFQVEIEEKIKELQQARLEEAQQKEVLKGELFRQIVDAQEAERERIARDLHDETGQTLTAIGMGLRGISTSLNNSYEPSQVLGTLRRLEALTASSLQELQHIISDLRPSHLDDLGLLPTLRWYTNELMTRADLEIEIKITGEEKVICPEYATSIFRILQEALTNIVKHANATQVQITFTFESEEIRIAVEDDGRGFDTNLYRKKRSWGLIGMQERATLLNGHFSLYSTPGEGTILEIIIPYCPIHMEDAE